MIRAAALGAVLAIYPRLATADLPDTARKLLEQGVTLYDAGDYAAAHKAFAGAKALAPDRPNPYRWLGLTEVKLGHCTVAVANLDAFLQRVPATDPRIQEVTNARDQCKASRLDLTVGSKPVIEMQSPPDRSFPKPIYKKWGFWAVVVGAVVTGVAIATIAVVANQPKPCGPTNPACPFPIAE